MATLRLFVYADLPVGSDTIRLGSLTSPLNITVTKYNYWYDSVAASTTWSVWTSGLPDMADFDFLWVKSDGDTTDIEFTTDRGNDVGDEIYTIRLLANHPFTLARDDSFANYTANFGGGTIDVIDRIRIRNNNTTTAANVEVMIAT